MGGMELKREPADRQAAGRQYCVIFISKEIPEFSAPFGLATETMLARNHIHQPTGRVLHRHSA